MRIGRSRAVAVCAAVCLQAELAGAQTRVLTLAEALTRAREQAPQIESARLALEEIHGRLVGASLRSQANPEIDVGLGNRQGTGSRFTDFEIGLGQTFEPGSRRTRVVLRSAAAAYYRAVYANQRIRLLDAMHELAAGVYSVADRRYRAGDIAVLDVNIARASLGRVRAERESAESQKALALGDLRQLLRLDEDISVEEEMGHSPRLSARWLSS